MLLVRSPSATRLAIGWNYPAFEIPEHVYKAWSARDLGKRAERRWNRVFASYQKEFPGEAGEFRRRIAGELPAGFDETISKLIA